MVLLARVALLGVLACPLVANAVVVDEVEFPCGDCNRNGSVTIAELAACANAVQLGVAHCPACDIDGDGQVTQDEADRIILPIVVPPPACPPVQISIGTAGRNANGKVFIPITLAGGRFTVGGTQSDILFDNTVLSLPSVARCRINPALDGQNEECAGDPDEVTAPCKNLISSLDTCGDDPQPDGCPAAAGPDITRFRSLVTSFAVPVFNAIPDGLLYECELDVIDPDALPTVLTSSEVAASEPLGKVIRDVIGNDGAVTADPPPTSNEPTATATVPPPSSTPTVSRTSTRTPTGTLAPTPVGIQIIVGFAGADSEGKAVIPVSLFSAGATVGGMQNDILFDNTILSLASANSCRINPAIGTAPEECFGDPEEVTLPCKTMNRRLSRCGPDPQPPGCPGNAGDNISRFRTLIASTAVQTTNPLPDGLLYTCTFDVLDAERLPAVLTNNNTIVSNPFGGRLFPVVPIDGAVTDEPPPPASATPTPSPTTAATATPTAEPTATDTSTPTPSATPSSTSTSTPTLPPTPSATAAPPCTGDCDDSLSVTVDEITALVSVALGTQELAVCTAGDRDGDLAITVDELLAAVTNGLNGCPGGPSA